MELNVDRVELIAALTEKRGKIAADVEKKIAELQEKIDELPPVETVETWLRKVADLVKDGTVRAEQQSGVSYGARADGTVLLLVRSKGRRKNSDRVIPKFPSHNDQLTYLKRNLSYLKHQLAMRTEPYDAALKILNMSTDEKVGIKDGDYHGLLSGKVARGQKDDAWDDDLDADEYEDTSLRP